MGVFIEISIDQHLITPEMARNLVSLCPVDIFAYGPDGEQLLIRPDQEDECTLCKLCLAAAPVGALAIRKTYSGEVLASGGPPSNE